MTGITAVSSTGTSPWQANSAAEKAKLDYSAFLRLFVASMKSQDPTKPNDPSQTLSQLASFSNVEQSIKLNEKLNKLVESSMTAVAATLVGKDVANLDRSVSGRVSSIEVGEAGLIAVLQDGKRLNLSQGYMIRSP
jgi:flagellar basal-body rod modification protein FlgD